MQTSLTNRNAFGRIRVMPVLMRLLTNQGIFIMTYIYETLSTNQIADELKADTYAAWSYDGAMALAEYMEEYAENTGQPMELDTVALRCEFSEYATLDDFKSERDGDFESWDDVAEETLVIEFGNGSAIVQDY